MAALVLLADIPAVAASAAPTWVIWVLVALLAFVATVGVAIVWTLRSIFRLGRQRPKGRRIYEERKIGDTGGRNDN